MIFVTVGTHEQPFNRLVEYMDKWAETQDEEVVIQTGYCTYEPKHCIWQKLYPYDEMIKNVETARIVITHGGPSSFIMPLQIGKLPIVVPRKHKYNEHVNDHQVFFCRAVAERMGIIFLVEDIAKLGEVICEYGSIINDLNFDLKSNNANFNLKLEEIVEKIFGEKG